MKKKGEIPFSLKKDELYVNLKSKKQFDIVTPRRTYHLTDLMGDSTRWKQIIEKEQRRRKERFRKK